MTTEIHVGFDWTQKGLLGDPHYCVSYPEWKEFFLISTISSVQVATKKKGKEQWKDGNKEKKKEKWSVKHMELTIDIINLKY